MSSSKPSAPAATPPPTLGEVVAPPANSPSRASTAPAPHPHHRSRPRTGAPPTRCLATPATPPTAASPTARSPSSPASTSSRRSDIVRRASPYHYSHNLFIKYDSLDAPINLSNLTTYRLIKFAEKNDDAPLHTNEVPPHCVPNLGVTITEEVEEQLTNEIGEYSIYDEFEDVEEIYRMPLFDGYARMMARTRLPAKRFDIWAEVSAICDEGTLLSAAGPRDNLWLGLGENKAILRWNAGSGPVELRSGKVRYDGRSKISARRYKKDGMLRMGKSTARGSTPGRMSSLDVDPFIYIGRPPENITKRLPGAPSLSGFVGCVHRLRVSGRDVIPPARGLHLRGQGLRACTPRNIAQIVCP